jgi:formylglycine-generating enzyme required for sulfatase activity
VRSYLIHDLAPGGVPAQVLAQRLLVEPDVTVRRALILSLGEFSDKDLNPGDRQALVAKLQEVYCSAEDPGLHGAAEWLLRHWRQDRWLEQKNDRWARDQQGRKQKLQRLARELVGKRKGGLAGIVEQTTAQQAAGPPQWYVNGQGQTMVVIPGPVQFLMGSPITETGRADSELLHQRRIGRHFALAAKPVTITEFRRFLKDHPIQRPSAPTDDCPVQWVTWRQAAAYCNWLSAQEGIPQDQWCYEMNSQGQVTRLRDNCLGLSGYRLPTEAEMEYACRAGAITSLFYGEGEALLEKYAWYQGNSQQHSWPVGRLKPNDLGLFDMHGNVWCWCQDSYLDYVPAAGGRATGDIVTDYHIDNKKNRVGRGGGFANTAAAVRCANRGNMIPTENAYSVGFRPARTFP